MTIDLSEIAKELNIRAKSHPISELQGFRKEIRGLQRVPTKSIFSPNIISERWTLHCGGRDELQYNIGFEEIRNIQALRYGVAFSFETSQTLPKIDVLVPKVRFFNDFIQHNSEEFADMRMWHWKGEQSTDYMPSVIPPELVTEGVFIFLGKRQSVAEIDFESILDDFDRLFPLYKYVESSGNFLVTSRETIAPSTFQPRRTVRKSSTIATLTRRQLDIKLRHNEMQQALSRKLVDNYGEENIREEYSNIMGSKVDIAVRRGEDLWFYEIKTAHSPRLCVRQALGQLLEYAFWPGSPNVTKLIVVGESRLGTDGSKYLQTLRTQFDLPIEYEQIIV